MTGPALRAPGAPRIALVLAGGASRGAYEVGVLHYLMEEVARDLGHDIRLDILCGTSVGAINVCALAALATAGSRRAEHLVAHWTGLRVQHLLQPAGGEILSMMRGMLGGSYTPKSRGGIFHPAGLEQLLLRAIPFRCIDENLRQGHLQALTVSTTHVATGRTVVFAQRTGTEPLPRDPTLSYRDARISAQHALASAAIPILFPAVQIGGELYCDGGLRQNVPLSPARRLGADRLLVVNPHYLAGELPDQSATRHTEQSFLDPLFLLGKTLNALLLDRIDNDIQRLDRINAILAAGCRRYGPDFAAEINREMGHAPGGGLRRLDAVLVRSSQDIGKLAVEFVRSPVFAGRASGPLGHVLRRLADSAHGESDFLSYLLFDGEFAGQLIELGRADARAQHDALCRLFADV